jgi:hypothetical protein
LFRCRCPSAEVENSIGQNNLGLCYEHGKGVDIDLDKAFYWYEKSAEGGDLTGQNNLGVCYENGRGVDIDLQKAFHWYQKSAEAGYSIGQNSLLTAQFCDENCNCLRRNYLPVDHTRCRCHQRLGVLSR